MKGGRFARGALAAALAVTGSMAASMACAAGDVGVINHLAGLVTVTNGVNTSKAQAYMNIHVGDQFEVPEGVVVKVAYFQGGRQEWFSGPASFTIGTSQSIVRRGSNPQVSVLPSGVPQKISQTPDLVQIARLSTNPGYPSAREQRLTPQQQAEVREAREIYAKLRADTPPDDITPELYLYSVLQDQLLYGEMKVVVAEMAKRQPGNRDVGALADYVRLKTEPK
jgi:hypothetical protein